MKESSEDRLVEAMQAVKAFVADGEPIDIALVLRSVPVVWRAALATAALTAKDQPVNALRVAEAGGYSRGTAYRNNREGLDAVINGMPALVRSMLDTTGADRSRSELHAEIQRRDQVIAELRRLIASAEAERDLALAYARDLHQQLAPEFHAIAAEKRTKIRHLKTIPISEE